MWKPCQWKRVKSDMHIAEKNSNIPSIFDLSWRAADKLVHHSMAISQETPLSKREKVDFNILGSENIFSLCVCSPRCLGGCYSNHERWLVSKIMLRIPFYPHQFRFIKTRTPPASTSSSNASEKCIITLNIPQKSTTQTAIQTRKSLIKEASVCAAPPESEKDLIKFIWTMQINKLCFYLL